MFRPDDWRDDGEWFPRLGRSSHSLREALQNRTLLDVGAPPRQRLGGHLGRDRRIVLVRRSLLGAAFRLALVFLASMRVAPLAGLRHIITRVGPLDTLTTGRTSAVAFEFTSCVTIGSVPSTFRKSFCDAHRQKLHATVIFFVRCFEDPSERA